MNLLDIVIIALCLGFALYGIVQGVVRQLFSWGGIILGHVAGVKYYETAQQRLNLDFPHGEIVAYLLTFLGIYLAFRLVGLLIERWVRGSELSGTDRAAGMLAGFVKGALLSVLLVFVLAIMLPRDTGLLRKSKLAPKAMVAATWVAKIFPEKIRDAFREKTGDAKPLSGGEDGLPAAPQPKNRPGK
ncbi:MAG: CvpA family protein [Candidatus Deferrimicrobiaceae bacterium]